MTLAEFITELPLCGPWELRGPQLILRTAPGAASPGDCPLAAVTRLHHPAVKRRVTNWTHKMAAMLGLSATDAEIIADAADGLDATYAATDGVDFAKVADIRREMLAACGLIGADHTSGASA